MKMNYEKILIFHSNTRYLHNLEKYLKNSGFSTILANDADTAYQLAIGFKPNIIIWGQSLTSKNKSIIKNIKNYSNGKETTVIAISKDIELFDRVIAEQYGVDDFFIEENKYDELKSKIIFHLKHRSQITFMQNEVDIYKYLSETMFQLLLSQDIAEICDIAIEFVIKHFKLNFIITNVFNSKVKEYDYFKFETFNNKLSYSLEKIKEDDFWIKYYYSNRNPSTGHVSNPKVINKLDKWKLITNFVYQVCLYNKEKLQGVILFSISDSTDISSENEKILKIIGIALGNRIAEIRRIFGTERGSSNNHKLATRDLFLRLSENEIYLHVNKNLIRTMNAEIGMYISYNEGFKFLYPKYLIDIKNDKNIFENDKPPVLLLKDFPSFEQLINKRKTLVIDSIEKNLGDDIKLLKGFNKIPSQNIIIFPLIFENSVQGFFVIGKKDITKKYSLQEINAGENLLNQANEILQENRILKQANLTIKQLDRIFDLGTELTLDVPLNEILKKITTAIRRTLGWNVVILDMKNRFENKFKMVSLLGLKDADYQNYIRGDKYPPFTKKIKKSFKISNSYFFDHDLNTRSDKETAYTEFISQIGSEWNDRDWLFVPIESRGELLGMISLNDPVDRVKPAEDRVKSVEYFANQAAVAMENTQLFESLKSSQLRYRLLAETMTMGLVTCNFKGKILYVNQSLLRFLKLKNQEDLLDKSLFSICDSTSAHKIEKLASVIHKLNKQKEINEPSQGTEIELYDSDGEAIPFLMYMSPFYELNKKIGFFGVLSDLRNQKKLERLKADFNSMIVHDLRSPLNIIQGYVDIVRTQVIGNITEEQAELLTIAKENVYKVLKLIDNFLIASKLEVGRFEIETEINSINSLVETLFDHYKILAQKKNISLKMSLDENLPLLHFDKFRIEQVLTNFLSNAIKFSDKNGQIKVNTLLKQAKNELSKSMDFSVVIEVEDSGVGIPKNELKKVFNKYEQTEAGKNASLKGTGLGLAISREIIQLHNGEIGVRSKEGEGSTFYFSLPIKPVILE
jgi:PAS domain S-box-containing protein